MTATLRTRWAHGREPPSPRIGRGVDRVGGLRLTPLATVLVVALLILVGLPRTDVDVVLLASILLVGVTLLGIGVAWPLLAVRALAVEARSPGRGTVGDDLPVTLRMRGARGGADVRVLDPTGDWHHLVGRAEGAVPHRADRRGSFPLLRVEVRVRGPLGLAAAHRVHSVVLPHVVDIGPRAAEVEVAPDEVPARAVGGLRPTAAPQGDVVRAVRPYVQGDPAHLVHWPSTARTGTLVVREMEPPGRERVVLVMDLRNLGDDTEKVASLTCGLAHDVLGRGGEVLLLTAEAGGAVSAPVRSRDQVGRRLARAVPGFAPSPPEGWPVVDVGRWWRDRAPDEPEVS